MVTNKTLTEGCVFYPSIYKIKYFLIDNEVKSSLLRDIRREALCGERDNHSAR